MAWRKSAGAVVRHSGVQPAKGCAAAPAILIRTAILTARIAGRTRIAGPPAPTACVALATTDSLELWYGIPTKPAEGPAIQSNIKCGRKRLVSLVIRLLSSRMPMPAARSPTTQEPTSV